MKKFLLTLMLIIVCWGSSKSMVVHAAVVDLGPPTTQETTTTEESTFLEDEDEDFTKGLVPDVDAEGFWKHLYNKFLSGLSGFQQIIALILVGIFCIETLLAGASFISKNGKVLYFIIAMVVTALMIVCDIYAIPITGAFSNWIRS